MRLSPGLAFLADALHRLQGFPLERLPLVGGVCAEDAPRPSDPVFIDPCRRRGFNGLGFPGGNRGLQLYDCAAP